MKIGLCILLCLFALKLLADDEEFLDEMEADRKNQVEQAVKLNETREHFEGQITNLPEQVKKITSEGLGGIDFSDEKGRERLKQLFAQSGIRNQSPELIKAMIMGKVKDRPFEKIFQRFPKLLDIAVDVFRDKDAMPGLIDILGRKRELKIYMYVCIGIFIFGFFMRKFLIPKNWGFTKRLFLRMTLSLLLMGVSIGVFYKLFQREISPTVKIVMAHF